MTDEPKRIVYRRGIPCPVCGALAVCKCTKPIVGGYRMRYFYCICGWSTKEVSDLPR